MKIFPPYDTPENIEILKNNILQNGLQLPAIQTANKLIDCLVGHFLESAIFNRPTFIIDHPQCMCPLAKWHRSKEDLVERFELFICGHEIINAYTELNDPFKQRENFIQQLKVC